MSEFQEVMRQRKALCEAHDICTECQCIPFCSKTITEMNDHDYAEMERVVMKWAAEHSEPRYPTWKEWQNEQFPDFIIYISPCSFCSPTKFDCNGKKGSHCDVCRNKPIPADIAMKLGIEPIKEGQ